MSHLTDARDILFADPTDTFDTLSLDDHIEYAEWQVEVALANLDACTGDAEIDRASFEVACAFSFLNDLCEKRNAEMDAQYAQQLEFALGQDAIESDQLDKAIAEGGF